MVKKRELVGEVSVKSPRYIKIIIIYMLQGLVKAVVGSSQEFYSFCFMKKILLTILVYILIDKSDVMVRVDIW